MGTVSFWIDNSEEEQLKKYCKKHYISVSLFIKSTIRLKMKED